MTRDPDTMTADVWTDPRTRALDLFAGAGGWDLAAHALGVRSDGVEIMPEARATRDAAGLFTVHDDVWTVPLHLLAIYGGLIASPPCQTFSQAGSGSGRKALDDVLSLIGSVASSSREELKAHGERLGDDRTALVLSPLWYALHMPNVRWLAWEQVAAVLPVWEACAQVLREHGWHVWTGYTYSEQYGVAQTRKRAYLIASRDHAVHLPTPTHSRFHNRTPERLDAGVEKWVSMAEALGWGDDELVGFPRRYDGQGEAVDLDGVAYRARDLRPAEYPAQVVTEKARSWSRFPGPDAMLCPTNLRPNAALRRLDQPAPTMAFGHETPRWVTPEQVAAYRARVAAEVEPRVNNQSGTEFDLAWPADRPAPTLAGRDLVGMPGANANRFNGSTKSRNDGIRVTVAEAGVLQSFPHDHPWQGTQTKRYLQAGNAVPPLVALHVLRVALGVVEVVDPVVELATEPVVEPVVAPRFADVDDLDLFAS